MNNLVPEKKIEDGGMLPIKAGEINYNYSDRKCDRCGSLLVKQDWNQKRIGLVCVNEECPRWYQPQGSISKDGN
jgi:hypothetical protein